MIVWCGAELVRQVITAGERHGVQLLAENALEGGIYNADALDRMLKNSKHFERCEPGSLKASRQWLCCHLQC